jgi:Phage integrase family
LRSKWYRCSGFTTGITKPIDWHTFRHKFSTLMASLGVEAKVVQELVRHASFRTTMDNYTQALDEPKRQAQKAPGQPDHANRKGGSRMSVVDCCGEIAADLCKLLKKLAGTTRLELATSAVTGQRSNQLNYVPSLFSSG